MITLLSISMTHVGLRLQLLNRLGVAHTQFWSIEEVFDSVKLCEKTLKAWSLPMDMTALLQAIALKGAVLTRRLIKESYAKVQTVTFDIGPGRIDGHLVHRLLDEVVWGIEVQDLPRFTQSKALLPTEIPETFSGDFNENLEVEIAQLARFLLSDNPPISALR